MTSSTASPTEALRERIAKEFGAHRGKVEETKARAEEIEAVTSSFVPAAWSGADPMLSELLRDTGYPQLIELADAIVTAEKDIPVLKYKDEEWGTLVAGAVIHDMGEFKHYQPEMDQLTTFALEMYLAGRVLLVGHPGTGKTTLPKFWSALTRQPAARVNYNRYQEPFDIIGGTQLEDGKTYWKDGVVTQCVKSGYLLINDEENRMSASLGLAFQSLNEEGGTLRLLGKHDDDVVVPDPRFRCVATDNTKGTGDNVDKFSTAEIQDTSALNRKTAVIEVGYLPAVIEREVLKSEFPDVPDVVLKNMVQLAGQVRVGYDKGELSLTMSLRQLKTVFSRGQYVGYINALKPAYYNSLPKDEQGVFEELFSNVFGTKM